MVFQDAINPAAVVLVFSLLFSVLLWVAFTNVLEATASKP